MGHYLRRYWQSDTWYAASGPYAPYVPDRLAQADITLDAPTMTLVADATAALKTLDLGAGTLAFTEPLARLLMRSEALSSSRIEGLQVPAKKILEAEALDELGVSRAQNTTEDAVLANITAMQDVVHSVSQGMQITVGFLCDINNRLLAGSDLQEKGGQLRDEQNWIGGSGLSPVGAAYVPPEPDQVPAFMQDLVNFCNTSQLPPLALAAVAHAQFETIHPFVDGNGRTGRALIQIILKARGTSNNSTPPISLALATERKDYLTQLARYRTETNEQAAYPTLDESQFVAFFARAAQESCALALEFEKRIGEITDRWRSEVAPRKGSTAALLLNILASNPVVSVKSAMRLTGRSDEACRQALKKLHDAGVLSQNSRNRKSNIYTADEVLDEFTALERAFATPGANTVVKRPVRPTPQRRPG